MTPNTSTFLLYLIFVFSVAQGGWVEKLVIDKDYGSDCNAKVSCYVHSDAGAVFIRWKCVGAPYGITDMKLIPGLRMGDFTSFGFNRYKHSITLSKCYSKLVLTCEIDSSSRTVTLTSSRWVERLVVDEHYGSDCNAKVTCYVHSGTTVDFINWKCVGGPYGISNMELIPGLRLGVITSAGLFKYKQSVTLSKCYSKLVLTCKLDDSSRTVTLTSSGLSVAQIVGIVVGVVLVLSAIGGCIGATRRKRTRGVVVARIVNPMTNPVAPPYPVQPTTAGFHGYPDPPPYPGISTKE